jgi:hypothetical protein
MGTRSTIALEFADGTVQAVYCHWDGYLAHNGQILLKHYSNPFILRDLIDLGDLSSLRPTIGTKHAFSQFDLPKDEAEAFVNLTRDMCTFYGRDRGETGTSAKKFASYEDYLLNHQYEEYDYILRNDNGVPVWFVCDHDGAYVTLESAIMDEQDRIAQEETA